MVNQALMVVLTVALAVGLFAAYRMTRKAPAQTSFRVPFSPFSTRMLLTLAVMVLGACSSDEASAPLNQPIPVGPVLAEFNVRVSAEDSSMTFEPIVVGSRTPSRPNGLSLATYGSASDSVRLFNSAVVVSTVSGRKRFTADVGLQNLKQLAIGDEERAGANPPKDTMGIYIFQSNPVISCSPSVCDVQIFNQHGTGTFTAPNQKYFWYRDRVAAGGTTRANSGCPVSTAGYTGCQWIFDASSNTTAFNFFVQIRAAWEPKTTGGGDTQFSIVYEGDSLPELRAEPRWDITSRSTATTGWTVNEGTALSVTQMSTTPNLTREYIRRDSIRSLDVGFMQATLTQTTNSPKTGTFIIGYLGLDDNTRFLAIGLNKTQVGFITSAFAFIGTPVTTTPAVSHTYKLVKNGTGNVQLFIDGSATAAQTLAYTSFSTSVVLPTNDYSFFFFGHRSGTNGQGTDAPGNSWTTLWDQVVYKIGSTT